MRISSIISEYNPFHEGHKYHMENTKKITNSDYTIVIMSGNFTQRGTPAIIDKYARTKQALLNGADLVLELPLYFSTASAEGFAFGAVSILDKLGVIDSLVFGSESGNIKLIEKAADFLAKESIVSNTLGKNDLCNVSYELNIFREYLQRFLKQGFSFPKARAKALHEIFPDLDYDFLSSSNNILGIEYCRALKYFNSSIKPMTIARKDNLYHDETLSEIGKLSSATAIRKVLLNDKKQDLSENRKLSSATIGSVLLNNTERACVNENNVPFDTLSAHMPENSLKMLKENWSICAPISSKDFSLLLKYKLLMENRDSLTKYADVTSDLADRIYNNLNLYKDFDSFCELLKTKELTYTRIARSLIHILLDIRKTDYNFIKNTNYGQYARILGFRKEASPLLREIKKYSSIPMISKLSDSVKELEGTALTILEKDIQAAHIYESVVADKFGQDFRNEFQRQLVIV